MFDLLLTVISLRPSVDEMLQFSALGFGVVMFVLVALSFMTSFVGVFFKVAEKAKNKPKIASKVEESGKAGIPADHELVISAAVASMANELGSEQELVAVLTAAAYAVIGEECVVINYRNIAPDMSYARQGRGQLYSSKNYTPKSALSR